MKYVSGLAGALAVLVGCCHVDQEQVEKVFGGQERLSILRAPSEIVAYRIVQPVDLTDARGFLEWPVVGDPVPVRRETERELTSILLDPRSYPRRSKACRVSPGVKIRFKRERGSLDVYFCFECDILVVFEGSELLGKADFDYARSGLVTIMKGIFPGDAVIQGLKLQ